MCVCLFAYVRVAIYQKSKSNERNVHFKLHACYSSLIKVDTMDLSLSNSTLMDLLNATVDHERQRLFTDSTVKSCTVVEFASGKGHA